MCIDASLHTSHTMTLWAPAVVYQILLCVVGASSVLSLPWLLGAGLVQPYTLVHMGVMNFVYIGIFVVALAATIVGRAFMWQILARFSDPLASTIAPAKHDQKKHVYQASGAISIMCVIIALQWAVAFMCGLLSGLPFWGTSWLILSTSQNYLPSTSICLAIILAGLPLMEGFGTAIGPAYIAMTNKRGAGKSA